MKKSQKLAVIGVAFAAGAAAITAAVIHELKAIRKLTEDADPDVEPEVAPEEEVEETEETEEEEAPATEAPEEAEETEEKAD